MGRPTKTPIRASASISLPHGYTPRGYQQPFLGEMLNGRRYAALVWHRRAGKDTTAFNWLLMASQMRVGNYYYLFKTFTQGKRVVWEGRNREGQRLLDHIPPAMIASTNETDMRVVFRNGSAFQLVGTDNFDAYRGGNPVGLLFSEYADQNPAAWRVFAPIIRENRGWAVFVYTPLGGQENHGYKLFQMAQSNPEWFAQRLTVDDTRAFAPEDLAAERALGMDEDTIQQEYYCAFLGHVQGAYYQKELEYARAEGRLGRVPYDPRYPVETAADIGTRDATAIWFYQQIGRRIHLIDYYEQTGANLVEVVSLFRSKRYAYLAGQPHIAPHDIKRTDWKDGKTAYEIAQEMGIDFRVVPKQNPLERITAARVMFPRCYFDEVLCEQGLAALQQYHKEWDDVTKSFHPKPAHDWSSHGADAFGHLAVGIETPYTAPPVTQAVTDFSVFGDRGGLPVGTREPTVERDFAPWAA